MAIPVGKGWMDRALSAQRDTQLSPLQPGSYLSAVTGTNAPGMSTNCWVGLEV